MQSFIVGLLLATVSGLTVVAFRHPNGFARLFPYLLALITIFFLGLSVWHVAVNYSWTHLLRFVPDDILDQAVSTKEQLQPSYVWVVTSYVGAVAFLLINLKLPRFLQGADEDSTSAHEQNSH